MNFIKRFIRRERKHISIIKIPNDWDSLRGESEYSDSETFEAELKSLHQIPLKNFQLKFKETDPDLINSNIPGYPDQIEEPEETPIYNHLSEEIKGGEMPRHNLEVLSETAPLRGPLRSSFSEMTPIDDIDPDDNPTTILFKSQKRIMRNACILVTVSLLLVLTFVVGTIVLIQVRSSSRSNSSDPENRIPVSPPSISVRTIAPSRRTMIQNELNQLLLTLQSFPLIDVRDRNKKEMKILKHLKELDPIEESKLTALSPTQEQTDKGLTVGQGKLQKRDEIERDILANMGRAASMNQTSSGYLHQKGFRHTSKLADEMGRAGYGFDCASRFVSKLCNMSKDAAANTMIAIDSDPFNANKWCGPEGKMHCNQTYPYRSANGTCNNLQLHHEHWGSAYRPYRRILIPDYADGISKPRMSSNNASLPNARLLSVKVHPDIKRNEPYGASLMLPQWGQFIDHDITASAASTGKDGGAIPCCDFLGDAVLTHPECIPIFIEANDPFYSRFGKRCMNMVRDAPAPLCRLSPREQFNQITSFIDGSVIYGSSDEEMTSLRESKSGKGRLKTTNGTNGRLLLPLSARDDICNRADKMKQQEFCFKSGDSRVNEQLGLTSMHLIWTRHHNKVAEELALLNPHWDDEKVFQESRQIIGAHMQHITYSEFLPKILGTDLWISANLTPKISGYDHTYNHTIDPTISNVFAAGAFRFGHSMMQGLIKLIGKKGKNVDFIQLHKLFFNPFPIWEEGKMDAMLRGLVTSSAARADTYFTSQFSERLFQTGNESFGVDLVAINIERGRERGLPGYLEWRQVCGLQNISEFEDLAPFWDEGSLQAVSELYKSPKDIDLYTGGLAEIPIPGAILGPTFACLIADQFYRLKFGDRFWYENEWLFEPLSPEQLDSIRSISLSRIICDNSDDISELPIDAFTIPSTDNPVVSCKDFLIPHLDLEPWAEEHNISNNSTTKDGNNSYLSNHIDYYYDEEGKGDDLESSELSRALRHLKLNPSNHVNPKLIEQIPSDEVKESEEKPTAVNTTKSNKEIKNKSKGKKPGNGKKKGRKSSEEKSNMLIKDRNVISSSSSAAKGANDKDAIPASVSSGKILQVNETS